MTLRELSQLYYLSRMIERNQEMLDKLEAEAMRLTPSLTGMPKPPGVSDPVGEKVSAIVDLRERVAQSIQEYDARRNEIMDWIDDIWDVQIRLIFVLRFIDLKSWQEVADDIGGGNTEHSVKKACYRYLKDNESQKVVPNVPNVPSDYDKL